MMKPAPPIAAGKRAATSDRTRVYVGAMMSFLVQAQETGGRLNILEVQARPGDEPPPHYHARGNELYYVLEGTLEMFLEGLPGSTRVGPNELLLIPQNCAHAVIYHSSLRLLALVYATAGQLITMDEYFFKVSHPAGTPAANSPQAPPKSARSVQEANKLAAEYDLHFLSPEEVAQRLPNYRIT